MTFKLWMFPLLTACWLVSGTAIGQSSPVEDGSRPMGTVRPTFMTDDDALYFHHDGTFEYGFCWFCDGCVDPPYDGALAEAFDLGPGVISAGAFWLTSSGCQYSVSSDIFVWAGGLTGPPGEVVAVVSNIELPEPPLWPQVAQMDTAIHAVVDGEFTIGYWSPWAGTCCAYLAADLNGPGGHPWTNVAEGLEWPSGWQHPEVVWEPPIQSLGIGVYFAAETSGAESPTWEAVSNLLKAEPNPTTGGTTIAFETADEAIVRVDVLDLSGRSIRRLCNGHLDPGNHRLRWDGRDASGTRVSAGAYYARVIVGGQQLEQRVLVLR